MADRQTDETPKAAKPGRLCMYAALVLAVIFVVNVVVGKVAISQGATTIPGLGDVGEFLTLFAAVVFFIAACLAHERHSKSN